MRLLIVLCLGSSLSFSHGRYSGGVVSGGGGDGYGGGHVPCGKDQIRNVDGTCADPVVNRNVFLYAAPQQPVERGPPPIIPKPRLDYNLLFVKTPEQPKGQEPIVIPPPRQKTLVYVLNKKGQIEGQKVIEVPYTPEQPEVIYVNYNEGDNHYLPGGIDLQSALQSTVAQQGQVIEGGGGGYAAPPSNQYGPP